MVVQKESKFGLLLVITDAVLIGKTFIEGRKQLDLTKKFYQGDIKSREEVKKLIFSARHLHLTGKEAVAIGVESGMINGKKILQVHRVPHAEVVME